MLNIDVVSRRGKWQPLFSGRSFLYLCIAEKKDITMTFDEAATKCKQIESYTIGSIVKDMKITSLFIGPTDWNLMSDYLNAQIQKGQEVALIMFKEKSFSVYGMSVDKTGDVPRSSLVNLDDFDKMMSN